MFKDILITLSSHPQTAGRPALRRALAAARMLGAHVTCLVSEPEIPLPVGFHPYSQQIERDLGTRQTELRNTALGLLSAFEEEARALGLSQEGRVIPLPVDGIWDAFVDVARMRDLTAVPFVAGDEGHAGLVQALAFESGRPVLVLPDGGDEAFSLDRIVVAWDFSRAAARAVGDALPLLRRAGEVRVVMVASDKQTPQTVSGAQFIAHLARAGVEATFEEVARGGRTVGEALDAAAGDADLLVMGAFGHSRIRDFFLGGATRHMLEGPRLPTLLSH